MSYKAVNQKLAWQQRRKVEPSQQRRMPTWLLVAVARSGALGWAASAVICPLL